MLNPFVFAVFVLCSSMSALGQTVSTQEEEQALRQAYGDEEMVSLACGYRQPLSKAPSAASVITAADIKAMGATDLDEVLETVPGLHVLINGETYSPIYTFRGIYSTNNSQVLMMINGIPVTDVYTASRSAYWGGMPVQAISRIEVVRGPGSALYGADAAAGVINIITKTRQDMKGNEAGGRVGSFNTRDGWLLQGGEWAGFDVTAAVEYHKSDGQKRIIDSDQQTAFDQSYGTHASLAPGPVNMKRNNLDVRLDFARADWRFRAGLQQRKNMGMGASYLSGAGALQPSSSTYTDEHWNADLTWHNSRFTDDWDVEAQLSYLDLASTHDSNNVIFPAGTRLPIGSNGQFDPGSSNMVTFPNGYVGNPDVFTRTTRASLSGNYAGFEKHLLRMGAGYNYNKLRVTESKNFGLDPTTGLPINGASVVDVSNTSAAFILGQPYRRNSYYYLQDEWKFAKDWALTGGVRHEHFSDFGNTTNPRLALVWESRHDLTTKLMYGRAFRAPAFWELYLVNAPFTYSNRNLRPETMYTTELAFEYKPHDDLRLGWDLFHYQWKDIIGVVPDTNGVTATARNSGEQTGNGSELEAEWKATGNVKLSGNYSYQKSTDKILNHDAGNAPRNQIYLRANWTFLPDWQFVPQAKWISGRERVAGDNRPPITDYTWVDMSLRYKNIREHWEAAFSVRNLLNADAREPSPGPAAALPNDLPLAGRSIYGEIRLVY